MYDVVTELTCKLNKMSCDSKCKQSSYMTDPSISSCDDSVMFSARSSSENINQVMELSEEMSPQSKLECLKQTLKQKMKQMQAQDDTINDLECQLRKAKKDLTCLKESYDERNPSRQFLDLASYEAKLNKFKEILIGNTLHLEKSLRRMSNCVNCSKCTCKDLIGEEGQALQCIKRDLALLKLNKCNLECFSSLQNKQECSQALTVNDLDKFQLQAVTAVAALEEMKEQIDIIHEIIKKYLDRMTCDYEKGQIEECESKFYKYRSDFDGITDNLCGILESVNRVRESSKKMSKSPEKLENVRDIKDEQKRLQLEINEREKYLKKIKEDVKGLEAELKEKRCQSEEQEKELKLMDKEIVRLSNGVKAFRERLKGMQINAGVASNMNNGTKTVPSTGSWSSLSGLSDELQELCDILTASQTSIPGFIEKWKEENCQLQNKLCCLEKCLKNKDQTLELLQQSLKLKSGQIEELNCKVQSSEVEVKKLRKEVDEKGRLICNLQDSMRKAKEFEIKIKDDNIEALQFEICELEYKLKSIVKEMVKKEKEFDELQDEILYVSSKNFFLNREIDVLEPKLGKLQKNLVVYEDMIAHLQGELRSRECEVEHLYEKVRDLEQELEYELKRCEQKTHEDLKCINELSDIIRNLQKELENNESNGGRLQRSPKNALNETSEEYTKNPDLQNIIHQLRIEVKRLKQKLRKAEKHEDINSKGADSENVIKREECRQQLYNDKISEPRKILEEIVAFQECEKDKLEQRLCKLQEENIRSKKLISKLNDTIKCKTTIENRLKETINQYLKDLENVRSENERLRAGKKSQETCDSTKNDLQTQKSNPKMHCFTLRPEIEKEEQTKKALEARINTLNDMLNEKTHQFNELTQNYKCTSLKAQEAVTKLKDAEDRLKCMKMEMNTRRICDEENEDQVKKCLEDALESKTAECSDLINEVQCLQIKIKTMQGEFISSQTNTDCELSRLEKEITHLQKELDLAEKENWNLKCDMKKLQDELKNKSTSDGSYKDEIEKKNKELFEILREKNSLLESVDDLHKRLEELCMDNTAKEKENRDLKDQYSRLKKELSELENELCETRRDLEALQEEYAETVKKLKCSEKKMENLKRLYCKMNEENASLQEGKKIMEKELYETRAENFMLKEKMLCTKKQKEVETKKTKVENSKAVEEKMKYCAKIKELNCKIRNFEEHIIPKLEDEIMRRERCLEGYKIEFQAANESSQRMREESLRVIQCTKKYLAAQKCVNDSMKVYMKDNRHHSNNITGEIEEQLKSVSQMNEYLYLELQSGKNAYMDGEPRSFSPLPWGCSNVERDDSSPEFLAESGFQSMQPSPTNMSCLNDYCAELKRTSSQWNSNVGRYMDNNDYTACRNSSIR